MIVLSPQILTCQLFNHPWFKFITLMQTIWAKIIALKYFLKHYPKKVFYHLFYNYCLKIKDIDNYLKK